MIVYNNENCHPEKTNVDRGRAEVDFDFWEVIIKFQMLTSVNWMLNKYIVLITSVLKKLNQLNGIFVHFV